MRTTILTTVAIMVFLVSCTPGVPNDAQDNNKKVSIFPDYTYVVLPPNIAPCNFHINDSTATEFVTVVEGTDGQQIVVGGQDAQFGEGKWHSMLEANKGSDLTVTVYARQAGSWERYEPFTISVAEEPIDEYITYRYIEASYKNYNELSICQRHLTDFDEQVVYSNRMLGGVNPENEYQCINCHNFQNYHTDNFQFHVRYAHAGTVIVSDGKPQKFNLKTDSTIGAGVYTAWHPFKPIIAYSLSHTVQTFLINEPDHKIEVLDTLSDLVIYHIDTNEIQIVQNSFNSFETYPSWSPDGKYLYYSSSWMDLEGKNTHYELGNHYDLIRYDLIRQSYDDATRSFGEPDTVVKATAFGRSATHARISPDGRYLMFSSGDFGHFMLHHFESDLYVKDLQTDSIRQLSNISSNRAESYHVWSSNGRWILFSTRCEDNTWTRLYIGYFDPDGNDHKPFALPQRDPLYNKKLLKAFNLGEFMVEPIKITPQELAEVIEKDPVPAKFYK
mgnify:CR=1 FL=1